MTSSPTESVAGGASRRRDPVDWDTLALRSVLFAPGDHERRLRRIVDFGADMIVIDLEDAVAGQRKELARRMTREATDGYEIPGAVTVRVNGLQTGLTQGDVDAVVSANLDAVVLPKVETVDDLPTLDAMITAAEAQAGLTPGALKIVPLIETPLGIVACEKIAATAPERVQTFAFGGADFSTEMRIDLSVDRIGTVYARSRLAVAVRAAGLPSPVDGPFLGIEDHAGFIEDCRESRSLGFQGRLAIHPSQVALARQTYSHLEPEEVERLQIIVTEYERAIAAGIAAVRVNGGLVDGPVYEMAKRRLAAWVGG